MGLGKASCRKVRIPVYNDKETGFHIGSRFLCVYEDYACFETAVLSFSQSSSNFSNISFVRAL